MKKSTFLIFAIGFFSVILLAKTETHRWQDWRFHLINTSDQSLEREKVTLNLLIDLIQKYNVMPWVRTFEIYIQEGVASHSKPLTINTTHNNDRLCLLSIFLHEQIHLLEDAHRGRFTEAMYEIEQMFPKLPPELKGAPKKAYRHFIVIYFELEALEKLLGAGQARSVLSRKPKYRWIHEQIYAHRKELTTIIKMKFGLGFNI